MAKKQLHLNVNNSDGKSEDVTSEAEWTSSDNTVATVDKGLVTPVSQGKCKVTGTYAGFSASCAITVPAKRKRKNGDGK